MRIALTGKKYSGKSTAARYMATKYGYRLMSIAEPIKEILMTILRIHPVYLYNADFKEVAIPGLNVTGRRLMQMIGTEMFKHDFPRYFPEITGNIWMRNLRMKLDDCGSDVVVDDMRAADESNELHEMNFVRLRIVRSSNDHVSVDSHSSESGCDADHEILNDGSVDDLYRKIDEFIISQM